MHGERHAAMAVIDVALVDATGYDADIGASGELRLEVT